MCMIKKVFFSLKIKTLFFVSLAPFSAFRGPNLSAVNDQNPGKTPEKIKPTLHCRHYIMDITFSTEVMLEKLHHGHYD